MKRWTMALVAVVTLGLVGLGSPAYATPQENPPNVKIEIDGCEAKLIFDNTGPYTDGLKHNGPWSYTFDYRRAGDTQLPVEPELDGKVISDPPLSGTPFDGLYNPVPVSAGEVVVETITLDPSDEWIAWRLVRGEEQRLFFDWVRMRIEPRTCMSTPTTTEPVVSPSAEPTTPPVAAPELPQTGAGLTTLILVGGGLVAIGAFVILVARRRRELT